MGTIIKQPVISEKSIQLGSTSKYAFVVDKRANAPEIKKSVEALFKVKVHRVNIITTPGKPKRMGRMQVRRAGWKKAIVTLMPGYSIKLFEESKKSGS
ncbi:50S ribosomal protein L23 [candidate division Kazan bacterium RBG_13_50_9]|uniref:Large ribosomal subunit protein uL23 n=1 Tax=candidate division Kazan bacterium RBG_13_50_9 TaxID=1798535 RepID=A0A1F4NSK2_UNCK3|nr:MAG: 50S ribosomal protein L23 [candidate division Kazan bacterium RBG_13_50_9]